MVNRNYIVSVTRAVLLLGLAGMLSVGHAQSIVRGPYLQMAAPGSIIVKWRTDVPTDSVVRYGAAPDSLGQTDSSIASTTEHEIIVGPLQADTRYYYSVGTSTVTLAGGDTGHTFETPPAAGVDKATRIWVTGDAGMADANAAGVREVYKNLTGTRPTNLWLTLGDIAYTHGTDAQFQAAFFDMYPELLRQTVVWPTFGNHDGQSADSDTLTGPYYDIFSLPTAAEAGGVASTTEAYYSFDYGAIHFISLDSFDSDRTAGGAMVSWLINDLTNNDKQWTIAFWHHPPYSDGSHDSDGETELIEMRENVVSVLETYGVDLVLSGHSHSYERSYLLDGHYGLSGTLDPGMILDAGSGREDETGAYHKPGVAGTPREGAVYAVAGSSGKISAGSLSHPAMYISLIKLGSMVLDVGGNRLEAQFIDDAGAVLDYFTMTKGSDTFAPTVVMVEPTAETEVTVLFSEPLDPVSATATGSYALSGLTVSQAALQSDQRTVILTTTAMVPGATHTLTLNDVEDLAGNSIAANSAEAFTVLQPLMTMSFQQGVAPTSAYAGARDATLVENEPNTNKGQWTHLLVDGDTPTGTGLDASVLMYWDIAQIPAGVLVQSARIEVDVTGKSPNLYPLYQMKRDWRESEVTWSQSASGVPWTTSGAMDATDRGTTVLGATVANGVGIRTIPLNDAGVALVQDWIDGTTPNYGFIVADAQLDNSLDFNSREVPSLASRPRLVIEYRDPIEPLALDIGWMPPPATKGQFYWWQGLIASGGLPPYSWSIVGGWIPWPMTLDQNGVISGIPANVTTAYFTIQVTDANSDTATASSKITVNSPAYVCGNCHSAERL